jgi:phage terminase small subunit
LRDVTKQIIMLLAALGFDPTSRSRLGIAEVKARSRLQEIQDRARRANA